jgi:uncharacterized protein (DUF2141 family)
MLAGLMVILPVLAGELTLTVRLDASGAPTDAVRCSLYSAEKAAWFPNAPAEARTVRTRTQGGSPVCVFRGLAAGRYAFAGLVDHNSNGKLDTSLVGMPQEPWGTSNNVRPRLRAPTFEEAAVEVNQSAQTIEVSLR